MERVPNIAERSDPARDARIAELKAQYEAGKLRVDAEAVAARLVDSHLHDLMPPSDKV
jgi:anti-sigma28 factor (negative regulator of flagellin synthesis)